jgi:HK97 gp10 family phage protein
VRIEFKVDQREIDKLMRDLSAYGGRVAKKIEQETGYAALEVQQLAARKAPHNLGRLGSSIQVQRQARSVKISRRLRGQAARVTYIVGTALKYAAAVEFGSVPHWAPIGPLKQWAKRKLGDEGAAYAVQKTIAKRGTKPQPFLRPAYMKVIPGYKKKIKRILRFIR